MTTMTVDMFRSAYETAPREQKASLRKYATDAMTDATLAGDMETAQSWAENVKWITDRATARKRAAMPDYPARIADMRATLVAAIARIDAGEVTMPDGIARPIGPVSPNGTPDPKVVEKLTTMTGRKVGKGSVVDYVEGVFERTDADEMTIGEIRKAWIASDDYPTSAPSEGAIRAAMDRGACDGFATVVMIGGRYGLRRN